REKANEILRDAKDGSFLVRDSTDKLGEANSDYTLTLKCNGSNKLIKIYHSDGLYGFAPPLKFTSVVHLIVYHQTHTLSCYNSTLSITLKYPVAK
ncbi:hypothetical protein HELRODRAFT_136972, partial [Helobdella robusta]|uniref:SH2 domain-containing protein n=1 Tax=Helobdella robusta TaxID=6412 RepID=T1EIG8_HELRO